MRTTSIVKLLTLFTVAFSLAALSGPISSEFHLPAIPLAHAITGTQPCQVTGESGGCSEFWYPAGPQMATEQVAVSTSEVAEYTNLQSASTSIDFSDWEVPGTINPNTFTASPFYLTATVPALGYYEIQFMQANTYWTCDFAYGTSPCGIEIRLGVAHMLDRNNFATSDPNIAAGTGTPIDVAVPTTVGGAPLVPNRCTWDSLSIEYGNRASQPCSTGADGSYTGGVAYRNATAPTVGNTSGCSTQVVSACQEAGSADLNLAAQHIANGLKLTGCTGCASISFDPVTSRLTNLPTAITSCGSAGTGCTIPNFFVRNDHLPRLDLGNAYAAQICYLFTGSYTTPCPPFLSVTDGSITQFLGFQTSPNSVNKSWWFYTAGYSGPTFYDGSLYFGYDSTFASASCPSPQTAACTTQVIGGGTCNNASVPTASASDYMYICNPTYDNFATSLEVSPCLGASGTPDPAIGSNSNSTLASGTCSTGELSSISGALRTMDYFGRKVYTLPVYETRNQYGYLKCDPNQAPCNTATNGNSWSRAVNDADLGLPNFFTWLNAWNPRPTTTYTCGPTTCTVPANTIRQGFKQNIKNENPFIASTIWDTYIEGNVYDSLYARNPLSTGTFFNWMTTQTTPLSAVSYNSGISGPPTGTCTGKCNYRFALPTYETWQDGRTVTAYDVAFSYLSEVGNGAFLGTGGATMSGITILSPFQFDISVTSNGPFELQTLTGVPIIPGFWASAVAQSTWASDVAACSGKTPCGDVQYTLTGSTVNCAGACTTFPAGNMAVQPAWLTPSYSPIAHHTFVGSSAWQCGTVSGTTGSGTCDSPAGPGGSATAFTLSAFTGYFRSSAQAATWIWSQESDQQGPALSAAAAVGSCNNVGVNLSGICGHWQQGIGNPGSGTIVSVSTVTTVDSFYQVNWVSPNNWATWVLSNNQPAIAAFPPLLYVPSNGQAFDGSLTLTPAPGPAYNPTGCTVPNTFYNC